MDTVNVFFEEYENNSMKIKSLLNGKDTSKKFKEL